MAEETTEVILEVGKTAAKVENLESQVEEQTEKTEEIANRQKWTDDMLDSAFNRIWELESRVAEMQTKIDSLEIKEEIEEENNPGIHEEEEEESEDMETIINVPKDKQEVKHHWNPFR